LEYFENLNIDQRNNIALIVDAMNKEGITNKFTQAGILSILSKETDFKTSSLVEKSYRNTSNNTIRQIFKSKLGNASDNLLNDLKKNDKAFFNAVYGGRYNTPLNQGYKYRGRGFNQITFVPNYQKASKYSGIDLVMFPEKLEKPKKASKVAVSFFKDAVENNWSKKLSDHYNSDSINNFKSLGDSVRAMYHINSGLGKPLVNSNTTDSTGGFEKALSRVFGFYQMLYSDLGKNRKLKIIILFVLLGALLIGGFFLIRNILTNK